jgi:FHA domain
MLNSNAPSTSDSCPITFLREHPALACSLLNDFNSLDDVRTVIEPVLNPGDRCQLTPFYIQALITRRTAFLSTNLNGQDYSQLSAINSSWLVGRHSTCAIAIPNSSVSRCHAVIGQHATDGICVTDLGSANGTWVNRHKLAPSERRKLRDGDLVQFGQVQAEFFVSGKGYRCSEDSTYS